MARDEARLLAAIWKDDDFLALSPTVQRLYMFLLSQSDLSYCGVIPLRVSRWARKAAGMAVADVLEDLKALAVATPRPFVVVDEDTEEVFVRSLIRNDGIWKQPNLMKSARAAAQLIESPQIRAALAAELLRIPIEESDSRIGRRVLAEFLEDMGEAPGFPIDNPSADPSRNPDSKGSGKGSAKGSRNPSASPSQGKGVRGRGKDSPTVDSEGSNSSSDADAPDQEKAEPIRDDVERVCGHLADRIEQNGSKRPVIGQTWRDSARLLMDKDGRTERQVHNMIDWCQGDEFWRGNVMSMPTLRDQYDRMRLKANAKTGGNANDSPGKGNPKPSTTDARVAAIQALKNEGSEQPEGAPPNTIMGVVEK